MQKLQKYFPLVSAALLLLLGVFLLYPHFQYYIDPDGTAYLTISKKYAAGDFARAVNGYWSPWSCWLTAILIKLGTSAITASVMINTIGATGFLFISGSFFRKFDIKTGLQWLMLPALSFFLCYAVYMQSFDDLWECFFLLAALRLMVSESFTGKPVKWLVMGFIGALAYFAKAYSFPFFILNTACCTFLLADRNWMKWLKISAVSIGTMFLISLPWIFALHNKYGIWTTSTAGPLNTSWYLVGHPFYKEGIGLLIPPVYKDSPYFWEDPYLVNGPTPHFWSSWHLLGLQVLRAGVNVWRLLKSMLQISCFFPLVTVAAFFFLRRSKKDGAGSKNLNIAILSFFLFPAGFLLVNFEPRYIWYMLPLSMVIGASWIQNNQVRLKNQLLKRLLAIAFTISYLVVPLAVTFTTSEEGCDEATLTAQLKASGIEGSFASNSITGIETQRLARLAYFSGNPYYYLSNTHPDAKTLLAEMRRYKVKYYFQWKNRSQMILLDESGRQFSEVKINEESPASEIRVYLVNP